MTVNWCYTKDKNGELYVINTKPENLYKKDNAWMSSGFDNWIRVHPYTHKPVITNENDYYASLLDLSNIPEPSWEDEKPMIIIQKVESSINYYYL